MPNRALSLAALMLLVGCAAKDKKDTAVADSLGRDLELAPTDSTVALNDRPATSANTPVQTPYQAPPVRTTPPPAHPVSRPTTPQTTQQTTQEPATPPPSPSTQAASPTVARAPYTLAAGTSINASVNDSISSRHNKPGETLTATIGSDVLDPNGRVIIPAGSTARFTITALAPAENKSAHDGTIVLALSSINVRGQDYPVSGTVQSVEHTLKGRGVTAGDAAKVGVGAVAGAIAGRILGGSKGTVIGGVVGGAVGTGVAIETADRDVVVSPGAKISFTLGEELVVSSTN